MISIENSVIVFYALPDLASDDRCVAFSSIEALSKVGMRIGETKILRSLAVLLSMVGSLYAQGNESVFKEQMRSVLQANCVACHNSQNASSGLSLESYEGLVRGGKRGPAIVPGHSDESLLIDLIIGEEKPQMPLGGSLPNSATTSLAVAIDAMEPLAEAPKDRYLEWLYSKPKPPVVPTVTNSEWTRNPIDAFILARLEERGLTPAPPADRRALIRRVYFDLLGLPPSPEEIRRFVKDPAGDAYERLIEELLQSHLYGERWGRHWLDLVRYADTNGFAIDAERPTAWRYRDYVVRSFNQDKPYDQFIKEQLAGDELANTESSATSRSELLVALGFYRMAPIEPEAFDKPQLREDLISEATTTIGLVFLGQTVGCARCHDHKYDPIPQRDFYRLEAFLAPTYFEDREAPFVESEDPKQMRHRRRKYEDQAGEARQVLDELEGQLKNKFRQAKGLTPEDDLSKKLQDEFRRALNLNRKNREENSIFTDEEKTQYSHAQDWYRKVHEASLRYRPIAFSIGDFAPPRVPAIPTTYVLAGGQAAAPGQEVEPGFPEVILGKAQKAEIPFGGEESSGRRLALANWIASAENPLTARVMVNRIWQHHFGFGLARTPSDLGKNGSRPTHPELLDWLATQFIEEEWGIKDMHRLMLTSNAYRQSTEHPNWKEYAEADPNNELLWRMNWIRLDAEVLRDSILASSSQLNRDMGGPGFFVNLPNDMTESFEFFRWFPSDEDEQNRRSVYAFQRRNLVMPLMEVFDVANMSESCSERKETIVAPQALTLLNSDFVNGQARLLARRVIYAEGVDSAAQIDQMFWFTLGRSPSETEKLQAAEALESIPNREEALAQLGVVLFNTHEFLYLE